MILALIVNLALCAVALWSVVFALRPGWSRGGRRRWVAVPLTLLAVAVAELSAKRWAPLGGGPWRVLLGVERAAMLGGLFAGLVLLAARALLWLAPRRTDEPPTSLAPSRREVLLQGVAAGAAGVAGAGALWGGLRHRHELSVTELEVFVDGLPAHLEGLTLLQLSDLHIGVFTGRAELGRLIEVVGRLDADHVVITGDIVDYHPRHITEGMALLGRLRARHGAYAVLGNHDHYTGPRLVAEGLRRVGITPLVNGAVRLTGGAREGVVLVGVDDIMAPRVGTGRGPDLPRALAGVRGDEPMVLLAHNPICFDIPMARRPALQLSGHTHGGQINPAGAMRGLLRYVAGRYERDGGLMYVSRGLGVTGPPVRLASPPEIVRVGLTGRRRPRTIA